QDGREALVDAPVKSFLASSFEFPALLLGQDNRFHGRRCRLWIGSFRLPSLVMVNWYMGPGRLWAGCRGFQVPRCERQGAIGSVAGGQPLTGERSLLGCSPQQRSGRRS